MTHRGATRETNEDALAIGPLTACGVTQRDPATCELPLTTPLLIAVADGMGGHEAGEVASAHAVRTLATTPPQTQSEIISTLTQIDQNLTSNTDTAGLGTTIAGILLTQEGGLHFEAGDSRIYLQHGTYLTQISTDHRGPNGGLTQCLGGRTDGTPLHPTIEPLATYDRLLLCSDGLSDLVDLETMEEILNSSTDPTRTVKSLWAAAMNASGRDNITIVLVEPPR